VLFGWITSGPALSSLGPHIERSKGIAGTPSWKVPCIVGPKLCDPVTIRPTEVVALLSYFLCFSFVSTYPNHLYHFSQFLRRTRKLKRKKRLPHPPTGLPLTILKPSAVFSGRAMFAFLSAECTLFRPPSACPRLWVLGSFLHAHPPWLPSLFF